MRIEHPIVQQSTSPNLGDQSVETFAYNAFGQLVRHVDPEGHERARQYYVHNGIPNDPADREGYLQSITVDPSGFALTTTYEYDIVGNRTRVSDPKGQANDDTFNQLDQLVRSESRPLAGGTRYEIDYFYDANDNVTRVERLNLDETGTAYTNPVITTILDYDIAFRPVKATKDKVQDDGTDPGTIQVELEYDANLNLVAVESPEAVNGNQPDNVRTFLYDERDLLFRTVRGDDDTDPANPPPSTAVVTHFHYDANANVSERVSALRKAVSPNAPTSQYPSITPGDLFVREYDAYDRKSRLIDPEGNETTYEYDSINYMTRTVTSGPVDEVSTTNVRLSETELHYDSMRRLYRLDRHHFDSSGASIGDGVSRGVYTYDLDHRIVKVTDDNANDTFFGYDPADRLTTQRDHLNNIRIYAYDPNSNLTSVTRNDVSTDLLSPPDVFVTTYAYDSIDRLTQTVDPVGSVTEHAYDSKDMLVRSSDGVRGTGHPNGPGNETRFHYDGLSRLRVEERDLTPNGRGDMAPSKTIVIERDWDDNSRLVDLTDDLAHTTTYEYDSMNRMTRIISEDASEECLIWDIVDHATESTDQNGTKVTSTYDGLGPAADAFGGQHRQRRAGRPAGHFRIRRPQPAPVGRDRGLALGGHREVRLRLRQPGQPDSRGRRTRARHGVRVRRHEQHDADRLSRRGRRDREPRARLRLRRPEPGVRDPGGCARPAAGDTALQGAHAFGAARVRRSAHTDPDDRLRLRRPREGDRRPSPHRNARDDLALPVRIRPGAQPAVREASAPERHRRRVRVRLAVPAHAQPARREPRGGVPRPGDPPRDVRLAEQRGLHLRRRRQPRPEGSSATSGSPRRGPSPTS